MEKRIQIFYLLPVLFMVTLISCEKTLLTELPVNSEQKVIAITRNGIGIEFCLLSKEDEPATVFEEGENFKFQLAIINNVIADTVMYIVSDFFWNPDLFMVFKSNGDTIGKPWEDIGCLEITDVTNTIAFGEKWIMESPWTEPRIFENFYGPNTIRFFQCYFSGLNRDPLPKGEYYTKLTQKFCLGRYLPHQKNEFICTDTLDLKINFKIE